MPRSRSARASTRCPQRSGGTRRRDRLACWRNSRRHRRARRIEPWRVSSRSGFAHDISPRAAGQCPVSALSARLDVASESVENSLPALALLLDGMSGFAVECNAHCDTRLAWGELDLVLATAEGIFDQIRLDDFRVRSCE